RRHRALRVSASRVHLREVHRGDRFRACRSRRRRTDPGSDRRSRRPRRARARTAHPDGKPVTDRPFGIRDDLRAIPAYRAPRVAVHAPSGVVAGAAVVGKGGPEPWGLDLETFTWGVSFDPPALTFICSPNHPTGSARPLSVLQAALDAGPGLVVVDEAYGEF